MLRAEESYRVPVAKKSRRSRKKPPSDLRWWRQLKKHEENLTCENMTNQLYLRAQPAPHQSCDSDQAGWEQQQAGGFRSGHRRSSITDEFLWAWAARRGVLHHGRGLLSVDREIVGISVITTGDVDTSVKGRHVDSGGISRGQRREEKGYNQRQGKAAT